MPNVCICLGWDNLVPLKEEDLAKLPINDTPKRKQSLIDEYRKDLSIWARCTKCGLVRINKEQFIKKTIEVFGEKYKDVLFKKWTFHHDICPENSYIYRIDEHNPNIDWRYIYNTREEAQIALEKILKERLIKFMENKE